MTRLAATIAITLAFARPAAADPCNSLRSHFVVHQLPLGCAAELYVNQQIQDFVPELTAERGEPTVEVTGTVTRDVVTLDVLTETIDASCVEASAVLALPFDHYRIELVGAQLGDLVRTTYGTSEYLIVVEPGPCPAPDALALSCRDPIEEYAACANPDPDPDPEPSPPAAGGCSAGGSAGLAIALLVLRRRRARYARIGSHA